MADKLVAAAVMTLAAVESGAPIESLDAEYMSWYDWLSRREAHHA